MKELMTREFFTEIMEELQKAYEYHEELNVFFEKHDVDGYLYQPDCMCAAVKLLRHTFGERDKEEWINYFCFELDFGRKYKEGAVQDKNGDDIPLATIDHLYDLLTK